MSAFGGFCHWDGQPVSSDRLAELSPHLHVAGPNSRDRLQPTPWLAFEAHLLHFDRLSSDERQPHRFGQGCVLTWDGRLDNRDDLKLSLHRVLGNDRSDAAIVAAAYERWGLEAIPRLIGDWSLAIWDAPQHRIVLARDYMGNRPLYYRAEAGRLAFATGLEALVAAEHLIQSPDETFIAAKLAGDGPVDMTPFKGISALVAGHVLIGTRDSVTVRRYWNYEPATLRYRNEDQYANHLQMLLAEAVRVRLRASRPVWTHLSGGWDSSSVVCLAHRLVDLRTVEAPTLRALSMVFPDREAATETRFIREVEQWCHLDTTIVTHHGPPSFGEMLGHRVPLSAHEGYGMHQPVLEAGDHVVLTGTMGDVYKSPVHPPLAFWEAFRTGYFSSYARSFAAASRRDYMPLLTSVFGPLERVFTRRAASADPVTDACIAPALLAEMRARTRIAPPPVNGFTGTTRKLVALLYSVAARGTACVEERWAPVWTTHAYLHRPLVEFLLAVPRLAMFDPQFSRKGMRHALVDVLPSAILNRDGKVGIPQTSYRRATRRLLEEAKDAPPLTDPVSRWELVRRGVVMPNALAEEVARMRSTARPSELLARCLTLEAWLRSIAVPYSLTAAPALAPNRSNSPSRSRSDVSPARVGQNALSNVSQGSFPIATSQERR